jgi:Acetyltransferase (GNAT) family
MLRRHYEGVEQDEPFDPDWDGMLALERKGRVVLLTARNEQKVLVGYCMMSVFNLFCSREVNLGVISAFYLDPIYRRGVLAFKMLRAVRDVAVACKCKHIDFTPQGPLRHRIGKALKRIGWENSPDPSYWLRL